MHWIFIATGAACDSWLPPAELNAISHPDLEESSGLAASRVTPGTVWTHDDSGDEVLFRFALDGTVTKHDAPAAKNSDWEDIASASCPGSGDCLYIGDIGAERDDPENLDVFVVKEPKGDGPATVREHWRLTWPDAPRDAETLLVNPCSLDAWVVTRADLAEVYAIPHNRGKKSRPLELIATLLVDEPITAGDFSPDGTQIALRSDDTVWVYTFDPDAPNAHWETNPRVVANLTTPGEGLAWDLDGDLLFSNEGRPTPLSRMACQDEVAPAVCEAKGCGCESGATVSAGMWARWASALAAALARREQARR